MDRAELQRTSRTCKEHKKLQREVRLGAGVQVQVMRLFESAVFTFLLVCCQEIDWLIAVEKASAEATRG